MIHIVLLQVTYVEHYFQLIQSQLKSALISKYSEITFELMWAES